MKIFCENCKGRTHNSDTCPYPIFNSKVTPSDRDIQDIMIAYKNRDVFIVGGKSLTLSKATIKMRQLFREATR